MSFKIEVCASKWVSIFSSMVENFSSRSASEYLESVISVKKYYCRPYGEGGILLPQKMNEAHDSEREDDADKESSECCEMRAIIHG